MIDMLLAEIARLKAAVAELSTLVRSGGLQLQGGLTLDTPIDCGNGNYGRLRDVFVHGNYAQDAQKFNGLCIKAYVDDLSCGRYSGADLSIYTTRIFDECGNVGKLLLYVVEDSGGNKVGVAGLPQ